MSSEDGVIQHANILTQNFDNPQKEIAFLKAKLEETQLEFQEFQESSRELETEYETQIQQLEKKNSESINQISRLEDENDQLRSRYNAYTNDTQHKLNEYQQQIGELTALNDRLTSYIRELEQSNDDLERAQRALAASLEDFMGQLNQQIERNVLLENEVSEKEELECVVQRLKEETRDLRHEIIANKNSSDQARRKLIFDNYLSATQKDTSMQSTSPKLDLNDTVTTIDDSSLNGKSTQTSSQTSDTPTSNGSSDQKTHYVDSTTSPKTPQKTSRFSFSSPFSYSKSSPSKSTDSKSQQTSSPSSPTHPPVMLSPPSRVTALNIVNDLLRKVGMLESKLAATKRMAA